MITHANYCTGNDARITIELAWSHRLAVVLQSLRFSLVDGPYEIMHGVSLWYAKPVRNAILDPLGHDPYGFERFIPGRTRAQLQFTVKPGVDFKEFKLIGALLDVKAESEADVPETDTSWIEPAHA